MEQEMWVLGLKMNDKAEPSFATLHTLNFHCSVAFCFGFGMDPPLSLSLSLSLSLCLYMYISIYILQQISQAVIAYSLTHGLGGLTLWCRQPPPFHCLGFGCGVGWEPYSVV